MTEIFQQAIFEAVRNRGYLTGDRQAEVVRQVLKATEELGEVARCAFDGRPVPLAELADVLIPLANIAELQQSGNLLEAAIEKATADAGRGRRDRIEIDCPHCQVVISLPAFVRHVAMTCADCGGTYVVLGNSSAGEPAVEAR